jgi:hypothetical protein
MIRLKTSLSNSRWFDNQRQTADWLGIKNASKKAIERRCRKLNFEIEWKN